MIKRLKLKSEFSRNVITLMTGTTIAQAIPIAISPILTRLFTPEEFGVFAIYMAIAGFLSVVATLRYEHALVLPASQTEVDNLFMATFAITTLLSLILLLVIIFFKDEIAAIFNINDIGLWIYIIPLSVFLLGLYNSLNSRLIWLKNFKASASNKVVLSTTNAFSGVSTGVLGFTHSGDRKSVV